MKVTYECADGSNPLRDCRDVHTRIDAEKRPESTGLWSDFDNQPVFEQDQEASKTAYCRLNRFRRSGRMLSRVVRPARK